MITKGDLAEKFTEIFRNITPTDQAGMTAGNRDFFHYIQEHYAELDEGAKEIFDRILDMFAKETPALIEQMPDGREKREAKRIYKAAIGKHFDAESLAKILEQRAQNETEVLKEIRIIFINRLQNILDLLSDAAEASRKGIAEFAKFGLFYLCVDELLAAFHMAQHSFVNQSYSHLRTVLEALDKIELFNRKPEWAELWASTNPKDKRDQLKELSPSAIREKLGGKRYDPFYGFFSEFGPHGTFRTIQTRSAQKAELINGRRQIHFWIGGCPCDGPTTRYSWQRLPPS